MAERKGRFVGMALGCMALAFGIGFFLALFALGGANILSRYALAWQLCGGVLYLAAWTPAVLLVSSALALEGSQRGDSFISAATRSLMPALVLAGALSIFYLLVVPGVRERKTWYEESSALFHSSLADARLELDKGRLAEAERLLLVCRAIDEHDTRFVSLWDQVQNAFVKAQAQLPDASPPAFESEDPDWKVANRFYLEALQAQREGRLFDAHYLAKRSVAIYIPKDRKCPAWLSKPGRLCKPWVQALRKRPARPTTNENWKVMPVFRKETIWKPTGYSPSWLQKTPGTRMRLTM